MSTKKYSYEFQLLINSITNSRKFQGLRLHISKYKKDDDRIICVWYKDIPLSVSTLQLCRAKCFYKEHPELDSLEVIICI